MNPRRIELAAGTLALLLGGVAAWRTRDALAPVERPTLAIPAAALPPGRYDFDSLGAAAEQTVATDPFRLANAPAAVRFQPRGAALAAAAPPPIPAPPAPRPTLVVRAIVGGPPWQAVVDGLAAQAGMVVRAGDRFDRLVVARITADSVIVQGPDTTWKLTLKRDRP
jgi:hypothetical protein